MTLQKHQDRLLAEPLVFESVGSFTVRWTAYDERLAEYQIHQIKIARDERENYLTAPQPTADFKPQRQHRDTY